ncbi:MAG TPA: hypothetical protein RWO09_00940 [Ruminococcus sp.]
MKKILAICSIFFTICTAFTGCGSNDKPYDSNKDSNVNRSTNSAGEYVSEAVSGVGDAGKDIIEGVTDAVGDIVDGFDGNDDKKHDNNSTTSTRARD